MPVGLGRSKKRARRDYVQSTTTAVAEMLNTFFSF